MSIEGLRELPLDVLAERFWQFGVLECRDSSPLYERLSGAIAADPEILALVARTLPGQPIANLLFAAVQFLLLQGASPALAAFYPVLSGTPPPDADPWPRFRACCREHRAAILELTATRRVQTNEVQRCTSLFPAFQLLSSHEECRPLALIEIGTSAGLNLRWDSYGYDYGDGKRYGDVYSSVQLVCALRGVVPLPPLAPPPTVVSRVGVDLNPVDIGDPDAVLWLRALIWPEHTRRAELLRAAVAQAQRNPSRILAGDALDLLPGLLETAPGDATLCVYHSFTVNQFSREARERLAALLSEHSARRPIFRVAVESRPEGDAEITLFSYRNGSATTEPLAICNPHGRWLEWRLEVIKE